METIFVVEEVFVAEDEKKRKERVNKILITLIEKAVSAEEI